MKLRLLPYCVLFILNLLIPNQGVSQKINAPRQECLKNITSYSYTPPTGETLSSASWSFGDGNTSSSLNPQNVYRSKGAYLVTINATFASGQSRTDTFTIFVHNLPKAKYSFSRLSNFCFNNNGVCILDSSTKAEQGQSLTNTLVVWGDGNFVNNSNPSPGQTSCHQYQMADNYTIKIEVTDIYGCKSTDSRAITIKEQTIANVDVTNEFKDCYTKTVCIKNLSSGKNKNSATYLWTITGSGTDTNRYFSNKRCIDYSKNFTGTVSLKVTDANGCTDEDFAIFKIEIDSIPSSIVLSDSILCYGTKHIANANALMPKLDSYQWSIDDKAASTTLKDGLNFNPKTDGLMPGLHKITLKIKRGNCTRTLNAWIRVIGPVATFGIYNADNCLLFKKTPIDFISDNIYTNRNRTKYSWTIGDPYGYKCTTSRKNKDTGIYCNYGKDYFIRHSFRNPYFVPTIKLVVRDTVNGCYDSTSQTISFSNCNPYILRDSITLCQGDKIEIPSSINDPEKISIDSGKTFQELPYQPDQNLTGTFDVWFTFKRTYPGYTKFINDSLVYIKDSITYRDTIIKKKYLIIYPLNTDSIVFKFRALCHKKTGTVFFTNPKFRAGQTIKINWGDNSIYFNKLTKDTLLDSLVHIYPGGSISGNVIINISNSQGCSFGETFPVKYGYVVNYSNVNPYYCNATTVCPQIRIYDLVANRTLTNQELKGKVRWLLNDSLLADTGNSLCLYIHREGFNKIRIIYDGPEICDDTADFSVFIQNLSAGIANTSRTVFCNELKNFMDSSSILSYPGEGIINYNWDFGTGTFTNPVKNPLKALNTASRTIKVKHTIGTTLGCKDTIEYELKVIGSHPYFVIEDTIACESLEAIFHNLSENCKGYIWEFGDPDGTILPLPDKRDVKFTYDKPGRYTIKLNGYDSFYNPATNATYFCNAVFPDPDYQKDSIRAVVVLPRLKSVIHGPDTLCPNQLAVFTSDTLARYDYNHWFADGFSTNKPQRDTLFATFSSPGIHRLMNTALFNNAAYNTCSDTAFKEVLVLDVNADFDYNDKLSSFVVFFTNKSTPINAAFNWNFGDPVSGMRNFSSETHPSHSYGFDSGTYKVCLIATNLAGCKDTTCKDIKKSDIAALTLFNVFTPGNNDAMNDRYDVHIVGENYYHLLIYDRWGVLVFEGNEDDVPNGQSNWNGRLFNKGVECPSGTYYYLFEYRMENEDQKQLVEGTVTLIR